MQYRKFGSTGAQVSALGFGLMRLPVHDGDAARIDEEKTAEMVHYAVEHGINYFDTAYVYHREKSEVAFGKILAAGKGLRDRMYIATKSPVNRVETRGDWDRLLDTQLERLQTDHIDMYLLHSLNAERWANCVKHDYPDFLDKAKADGRITYAGFSFHDEVALFKTICDSYGWDHCQIQYNYMDEEMQAGTEGLLYGAGKGFAVIVMEPLRGGRLARVGPAKISSLWDSAKVKRTPAEWALRWVLDHPQVSTALSGMGEMSQVVENIATAETALPGSLSQDELTLIGKVRDTYRESARISCTGCEYCLPCPQGIVIPQWFEAFNNAHIYGDTGELIRRYAWMVDTFGDLEACAECGQCETACPQHLTIRDYLKEILAASKTP